MGRVRGRCVMRHVGRRRPSVLFAPSAFVRLSRAVVGPVGRARGRVLFGVELCVGTSLRRLKDCFFFAEGMRPRLSRSRARPV